MNHKRLWIIIGGLGLLTLAFLCLNFRAALSNTQAQHNASTVSIGEEKPFAVQRREKITLVVVGKGTLSNAVKKTVLAELGKAGFAEVALAQELLPTFPGPVWVIEVGKPRLLWTPVFATSQITIQAGFASNGDTRFLGDTPVTVDNKNGPALNLSAEYQIKDTSWGILTLPGYQQVLADALAKQIVETTRGIYQ